MDLNHNQLNQIPPNQIPPNKQDFDCKKFWQDVENYLSSTKNFAEFIEKTRASLPKDITLLFDTKINGLLFAENYVELIFSPQYSHKNIAFVYELINRQPKILRKIMPAFAFEQAKKTPRTPKIYATYGQMQSPYFEKQIDALILYTNLPLSRLIERVNEEILLLLTFQVEPKSKMNKKITYYEPYDAIKVISRPLVCCQICQRISLRLPPKEKSKWQKSKKYYCTYQCEQKAKR